MSGVQDTYWIVGHADGIGRSPKLAEKSDVTQDTENKDDKAWERIVQQPDAQLSLQELTEILNMLDRLRDPQ